MQVPASNAGLCEVCLRLDRHRLTQPLHPCRNPLPCSHPPHDNLDIGLALGSVVEIKGRRLACDICRLVAESLDKEPPDLDGSCHIVESEYCQFKLPKGINVQDPSITHFHSMQASVVFYTSELDRYHGPPLPWESNERLARSSHSILDLQARASSYTERRDTAVTSPRTEQDFLATVGGRYVSVQVDTQLIRAWLHQCERKHGKRCMHSLGFSAGDREPTFVIDAVELCLVDTPTRCRYVALSYVWGVTPVFTHLAKNSQDLRMAGSLRSLPIPTTIRDAITLVYAIGERYLWVDSVCIIQDDWKMKATEIMRMGMICSGALFTIIAAAGDHANAGLPGIGTRDRVQKILRLDNCELLTVIDNTPKGIDNTTWAQRAWTFQERILSNRVLVFSESQVYWSCRVVSHSEERALEEVRDVHLFRFPFPYQAYTDLWELESLREPSKYATLYYTLLSAYRQRRMTYKTDVLNAFDGVSETLATLRNDTFFWGLPESLFSCALSWRLMGHYAREKVEVTILDSNGSPAMIPIPSWSWAAWWMAHPTHLPHLLVEAIDILPVICFDIVDSKCQLVRIREQTWPDHQGSDGQALWKGERSDQVKCDTNCPPLRPGQLCFWTSFGNTKAVREKWSFSGPWTTYRMLPYPGYQPLDSSAEVVDQDFIVIAAGLFKKLILKNLILLAIEWEDGVAYRVGRTEATEAQWLAVENRQWRLITLG